MTQYQFNSLAKLKERLQEVSEYDLHMGWDSVEIVGPRPEWKTEAEWKVTQGNYERVYANVLEFIGICERRRA